MKKQTGVMYMKKTEMWKWTAGKRKLAAALVVTTVFVSLFGLSGCSEKKENDSGKVKVLASFFPMYDFAQKIGGDQAEVINMVPAGTEPHDWEPSTTDIQNLEEADLFVYSGGGMEHWAEDVLASLENDDLVVVEASAPVEKLKINGKAIDPHVWLDPMNAKQELEAIKEGFVMADPEHKVYYEENYETYANRLDELDQKFEETLSACSKKEIVVYHEAFGYLCDAYGLKQVGITGISPEEEPSPKQMEKVIDFILKNDVSTVFFEELESSKVADIIAEETGAQAAVLSPIEGPGKKEKANGEDYFSAMEKNLEALKKALNQ